MAVQVSHSLTTAAVALLTVHSKTNSGMRILIRMLLHLVLLLTFSCSRLPPMALRINLQLNVTSQVP
jgi:hypothetical protein